MTFLNLYQHIKNQVISPINPWDTVDFRVPRPKRLRPILTNTIQKLLKQLLTFLNFYQHTKNQFNPLILSWDTTSFSVLRPEQPYPFLTKPTLIFFSQLLLSMNLYQQEKKQAFSSFSEHFGPYLRNRIFPKYRICARTQEIL